MVPIVEGVLKGYNGAVIAYGQTGSGKTHTMVGDRDRQSGVVPRALTAIFQALGSSRTPKAAAKGSHKIAGSWAVHVSVLEIYNEKVRDLLVPGVSAVDIHEVPGNRSADGRAPGICFRCPDATVRPVWSPEEGLAALAEGTKRRETARTDMNHQSSRSHLIFTVNVEQTDPQLGATLRSRMHLVDLAGSERLKRSMSSSFTGSSFGGYPGSGSARARSPTGAVGGGGVALTPRTPRDQMVVQTPRDQRREAAEINKSLSQLALVIYRLTSRVEGESAPVDHVPYRDSMLTRLLAESFGGSSKTCLIITCSPQLEDREETRCSLEFGKRAKKVRNRAEINLEVAGENPSVVMEAMVAVEVSRLQRERDEATRERDLFALERARLAELASQEAERGRKLEQLMQEAAAEVLQVQESRTAEMRAWEQERSRLQATLQAMQEQASAAAVRAREEHEWAQQVEAENAELRQETARLHEERAAEASAV